MTTLAPCEQDFEYWCYLYAPIGAVPVNISGQLSQSMGPILLGDICCNGTESYLLECTHSPIGSHQCGPENLAGVECEGQCHEKLYGRPTLTALPPSPPLLTALNPTITGTTQYNESDRMSLVCRQTKSPSITNMLWLKHSKVISSHRAFVTITTNSHHVLLTLELADLVPNDADEYSCQVTSSTLGVKTASVEVTINGKW